MGGGGKGGGGGSQVTGYRYSLGLHFGLWRGPFDALVQIVIGDKTAWKGEVTTDATIQINKPTLFGGDDKEGGVVGPLRLMMGSATQTAWPALATMLRNNVPGFRGTATAFFNGQVCSNNPYPKAWKFRGRRALMGWFDDNPWYPEKAIIYMQDTEDPTQTIHGMNPAHIIYECLTNPEWGAGFPAALIDEEAFTSCANTFSDEGFGLCLKWNRDSALKEFIGTVIDHVGAVLYLDRRTGLIVLKAIRFDYDPDDLPVFDYTSGLLQITEDDSGAQDNTANEIILKYRHVASDQERSIREHNLASFQANGAVLSVSLDFPGIATGALASRVAKRELRMRTTVLKRYTLRLDRRGTGLTPGSVFKLSDTTRGLSSVILRVGTIEEPGPTENEFVVKCVQDVFGLPSTAFVQPQPPLWEEADTAPKAPLTVYVREVDYRSLTRSLAAADLAQVGDTAGAMYVLARRPSEATQDFELWTKADGEEYYFRRGVGSFAPFAVLDAQIGVYDTELTYSDSDDLDFPVLPTASLLDGEIIRIDAIDTTTSTMTIARGCVDTLPTPHAAGAVLMMTDGFAATDGREYAETDVVHARLLTRSLDQTYPFDTAADYPLTIVARHFRPFPPGDLKINGTRFADVTAVWLQDGDDAVFTWETRNRVIQGDALVEHEATSVTVEAGTTYTARVYSGTTLLRTETGLTGTTWTYSAANWTTDGKPVRVTLELESVRDSVPSWSRYRLSFVAALSGSVAASATLTGALS